MTGSGPLRLAATAIPIRPGGDGIEVLMVRRNAELSFGGLWTFPGGRIDPDDGPQPAPPVAEDTDWSAPDLVATARTAAVRETREETGLGVVGGSLSWFSHWVPPVHGAPKRFATWFFVARVEEADIVLDRSENSEAEWLSPAAALERFARGEHPMAVPTWVTIDDLRQATSVEAAASLASTPRIHHTRAFASGDGRVLCWEPDVAYDDGDLDRPGPRNRVIADATMTRFVRELTD